MPGSTSTSAGCSESRERRTMSRISALSLAVSIAFHGGALIYLAVADTSGPRAPGLSGGKGGGEIVVTIHPGGPAGLADAGRQVDAVAPDPAPDDPLDPVPVPQSD